MLSGWGRDEQFTNEYAEIFYQHLSPQDMVSASFELFFGRRPTSLETRLAHHPRLLEPRRIRSQSGALSGCAGAGAGTGRDWE